MKTRVVRLSVVCLALVLLGSQASAQDPGSFPPDVVSGAMDLVEDMLGYDPATMSPVNVTQSQAESGDFAFDCLRLDGLAGNVAIGALAGAIFHELLHKCYGPASSAMENGCWNEYRSCPHLAIDYAVHTALCQLAEQIIKDNCPDDPADCSDEVTEQLVGICEEIKRLEEKWNNPDGAAIVSECRNNPPCELPTGTGCPTGNSLKCAADPSCSTPDPSPYPPDDGDNNVLGPCEACGDFSN